MRITTLVDDIMTRKPATVAPEDSLERVRRIFENQGFHHVPVVEGDKLVGIVSYTDYLRIISEMCNGNTPEGLYKTGLRNILVQEVMTKTVVYLRSSDTVEDAILMFKEHAFHALPIIEDDHRLVGILSTHDLMKVLEKVLAPGIDYAG